MSTNNLGELEAFRAAHDCDEEIWDLEWTDDKPVYRCRECGRDCSIDE